MIDQSKTYRTRDGREVRIYATDGGTMFPIQGAIRYSDVEWRMNIWSLDGSNFANGQSVKDLVESDPHGILPHHRELLAAELFSAGYAVLSTEVEHKPLESFIPYVQAALIALARLDGEKGE